MPGAAVPGWQTMHVENYTSGGLQSMATRAPAVCEDTRCWHNGKGMGCVAYAKAYCASGKFRKGREGMAGENQNFPERHCCLCGKTVGTDPGALFVSNKDWHNMHTLRPSYGAPLTVKGQAAANDSLRARLIVFYKKHAPGKPLSAVDTIARAYAAQEPELQAQLRAKYGEDARGSNALQYLSPMPKPPPQLSSSASPDLDTSQESLLPPLHRIQTGSNSAVPQLGALFAADLTLVVARCNEKMHFEPLSTLSNFEPLAHTIH